MMIAKEYIDRIDKLNLFYLSFYVKRYFQWSNYVVTSTDGYVYEIFDQPFPISIRARYSCSVVHVGGRDSQTWMYAFADNLSNQGISFRVSNNAPQSLEGIRCIVIIIGV